MVTHPPARWQHIYIAAPEYVMTHQKRVARANIYSVPTKRVDKRGERAAGWFIMHTRVCVDIYCRGKCIDPFSAATDNQGTSVSQL